jgi:hypothetical protein
LEKQLQKINCQALGGGWSFSKVAAAEGWILNTKMLNMIFPIRSTQSLSPNYNGTPNNLLFAQCGNSIQELNDWLKKNKRSLKTSGASNGQTIVGCFSTGTHGSAIDTGSFRISLLACTLLPGPDKHIWLERESYPIVSDVFIQKFKTKLIADDELFNAALVSFGSFGFIHGVMIETEDIYLLESYRKKIPLDDSFRHIMETLDFSNANFIPMVMNGPSISRPSLISIILPVERMLPSCTNVLIRITISRPWLILIRRVPVMMQLQLLVSSLILFRTLTHLVVSNL